MSGAKGFYKIKIRKEALKFSAAHMTIFADGSKEGLHGHNYRSVLKMEFENFSLSEMLPFAELKKNMRTICQEWDEKVLLPERCELLRVLSKQDPSYEFEVCGKRYVLPKDETVFLPTDNVTTESLAKLFCDRFVASIPKTDLVKARVRTIEICIEEMLGQGASYVVSF